MDGPRSHRIEVVGLHHLGRHDPGLASDTHADRSRYKRRRGDVFEHVAGRLPNIAEVRVGIRQRPSARVVAREHGDQTTRVRAGERTQKQSIGQRKNGNVRADADGQHRDRHDRKDRARKQPAKSVPQVPPQILGDTETLHVAALFLDRLHACLPASSPVRSGQLLLQLLVLYAAKQVQRGGYCHSSRFGSVVAAGAFSALPTRRQDRAAWSAWPRRCDNERAWGVSRSHRRPPASPANYEPDASERRTLRRHRPPFWARPGTATVVLSRWRTGPPRVGTRPRNLTRSSPRQRLDIERA